MTVLKKRASELEAQLSAAQDTHKSEVAALRKQLAKATEQQAKSATSEPSEDAALLQEAFHKIKALEETAKKAEKQAEKVCATVTFGLAI